MSATPEPPRSYLRFPHLRGDVLVFTAEDDVWTAPLAGGRAYRLTADDVAVANPRLCPDGTRVAWTSWRDGAPEAYVIDLDGGRARRLTYWGDYRTRTVGWTDAGEVLVVSSVDQHSRRSWAYAVPADGGTPRKLPYGPTSKLALGAQGQVLLSTPLAHDMAWWKRYRGGTAGKLWWDAIGSGQFERIVTELDGQLDSPMLVGTGSDARIAFLSDHEGWGNLYSIGLAGRDLTGSDPTGGDPTGGDPTGGDPTGGDLSGRTLRRHTDHGGDGAPAFYVRHASTDGERVVYESAGQLWIVDSLESGAMPRRLDVRLSGPRSDRDPFRPNAARWLTSAAPDRTGRTSIALVRGTVHRLTHRDGPARTLFAEPGARARLAVPLGEDRAVWVDDVEGEDAVCIAPLDDRAADSPARQRYGAGEIGRVLSLAVAPDASAVALAAHDGRLMLLETASGELRELARGADGEISDLAWSPDSAWLAYCDPVESGLSRIMLVQLARPADEAADTSEDTAAGDAGDGTVDNADAPGPESSGVQAEGPLAEGPEAEGPEAGGVEATDGDPGGAEAEDTEVPEAAAGDTAAAELQQGHLHAAPLQEGGLAATTERGADTLVAVTEPRFVDRNPTFTSDGKYLAFLSRRSFDPIYDQHSFDLTFPASWRPFLVPLAARTPSPFGASPDGRPTSPADEGPDDLPAPEPDDPSAPAASDAADTVAAVAAARDAADASNGAKKKRKDAPPEVVVDVEGLAARVVPIPVSEGRYSGMSAGKDCLLWYSSPVSGVLGDGRAGTEDKPDRPVLVRYDLARRALDVIADPVSDYDVSGDGTRLVVRDGTTLRVLRTDRSGSAAPAEGAAGNGSDEFMIDTSRIVVTVDPAVEWRQMFDEAGRLMRDHFWVEDMAGVDWAAELARYRPLVEAVGSKDDLFDVLWELQGELGSSHAYVMGGGTVGDWSGCPGLLGADLEPAGDDVPGWRVVRVLPPETSAPAARSPLSGPGVDVRAGDVILEVNGRPVDPALGPAPLLVGMARTLVELTVRADPDSGREGAGEVRRVAVKPLGNDTALRYQDWVAGRRAFVADRSEGRLGYLHVPDMVASGWAQLHRDLGRETARDGLIIDVRGNSGGHTSQLVIEKLARKVIGWDVIRHGQPATYPIDAPRGPIVALADENSGSDGDIVTAAIKRMGIGPVVGTRTWGGVIGIDGRYSLVDDTRVTQPRYSFWFDDVAWDVENYGVDPDIEVVITPQDWVAGRDPQLERAVDLALTALAANPAVRPPDPTTRPSRARPPLPPRP